MLPTGGHPRLLASFLCAFIAAAAVGEEVDVEALLAAPRPEPPRYRGIHGTGVGDAQPMDDRRYEHIVEHVSAEHGHVVLAYTATLATDVESVDLDRNIRHILCDDAHRAKSGVKFGAGLGESSGERTEDLRRRGKEAGAKLGRKAQGVMTLIVRNATQLVRRIRVGTLLIAGPQWHCSWDADPMTGERTGRAVFRRVLAVHVLGPHVVRLLSVPASMHHCFEHLKARFRHWLPRSPAAPQRPVGPLAVDERRLAPSFEWADALSANPPLVEGETSRSLPIGQMRLDAMHEALRRHGPPSERYLRSTARQRQRVPRFPGAHRFAGSVHSVPHDLRHFDNGTLPRSPPLPRDASAVCPRGGARAQPEEEAPGTRRRLLRVRGSPQATLQSGGDAGGDSVASLMGLADAPGTAPAPVPERAVPVEGVQAAAAPPSAAAQSARAAHVPLPSSSATHPRSPRQRFREVPVESGVAMEGPNRAPAAPTPAAAAEEPVYASWRDEVAALKRVDGQRSDWGSGVPWRKDYAIVANGTSAPDQLRFSSTGAYRTWEDGSVTVVSLPAGAVSSEAVDEVVRGLPHPNGDGIGPDDVRRQVLAFREQRDGADVSDSAYLRAASISKAEADKRAAECAKSNKPHCSEKTNEKNKPLLSWDWAKDGPQPFFVAEGRAFHTKVDWQNPEVDVEVEGQLLGRFHIGPLSKRMKVSKWFNYICPPVYAPKKGPNHNFASKEGLTRVLRSKGGRQYHTFVKNPSSSDVPASKYQNNQNAACEVALEVNFLRCYGSFDADVYADIEISWGDIEVFDVRFSGALSILTRVEVKVSGAFVYILNGGSKQFSFGTKLVSLFFVLGIVPFEFEPEWKIIPGAEFRIGLSATFTTGFSVKSGTTMRLWLDNKGTSNEDDDEIRFDTSAARGNHFKPLWGGDVDVQGFGEVMPLLSVQLFVHGHGGSVPLFDAALATLTMGAAVTIEVPIRLTIGKKMCYEVAVELYVPFEVGIKIPFLDKKSIPPGGLAADPSDSNMAFVLPAWNNPIKEGCFFDIGKCDKPLGFNPPESDCLEAGSKVKIDAHSGGCPTLFYTVDGSEVTEENERIEYDGEGIVLSEPGTYELRAVAANMKKEDSQAIKGKFVVKATCGAKCEKPVKVEPADGAKDCLEAPVTLRVERAKDDECQKDWQVLYTVDGSEVDAVEAHRADGDEIVVDEAKEVTVKVAVIQKDKENTMSDPVSAGPFTVKAKGECEGEGTNTTESGPSGPGESGPTGGEESGESGPTGGEESGESGPTGADESGESGPAEEEGSGSGPAEEEGSGSGSDEEEGSGSGSDEEEPAAAEDSKAGTNWWDMKPTWWMPSAPEFGAPA